MYERFRPLRFDPGDPNEGVEVSSYGNGAGEGRLYVTSGGSGAFLDPLIEFALNPANGSEVRSADHHFIKISIAGNTLHYSAIRTTAGNTSGGGDVIDQLTLARPGPDPCSTPQDPDGDGDGYPRSLDCRDDDPSVNPGAPELCGNTTDEDCSGSAEPCPPPPADADGDGSPADSDCDDGDPLRYPEHPEIECDGIDNDCDELEVCNPDPPDAAVAADAAPRDAEPLAPDAGAEEPARIETSDCACSTSRNYGGSTWFVLVLLVCSSRRLRKILR